MKNHGKKITCKNCGAKFYNFNKFSYSCPKCLKLYDKKPTQFISKKTKPENEELVKIDLIFVKKDNSPKGKSVLFGNIELPEPNNLKAGWYGVIKESISKGLLTNSEPLIFLKTSPIEGLKTILSSYRFPNIGLETASSILNDRKDIILFTLGKNSTVVQETLNLNEKISQTLAIGWKIKTEEIITEVFFRELGFSLTQIKSISGIIGNNIIRIIEDRPFGLLGRIPRVTFEQLERLYKRLGKVPTDKDRSLAATHFWLNQTEERRGHTCAPFEKSIIEASKISKLNSDTIAKYIIEESTLFPSGERYNKKVISTENSFQRDEKVLKEFHRLQQTYKTEKMKPVFKKTDLPMPDGIDLSDQQLKAINSSIGSVLSVITGGPGSGKSTLVVGLVKAFEEIQKKVLLCAPTGRAAKRLSEYKDLKKLEPSTIHMHLALLKSKKYKKYHVIIVDEASMIDIKLLLELLINTPDGCSIVFVGDADQLPPIGPGQPFKDIIESNIIPVVRLTGNYRQESLSDIILASRSIIKGQCPILNKDIDQHDFVFLECPKGRQDEMVLDFYFNKVPSYMGTKTEDIQIISPMHKGEVGIKLLNEKIQKIHSKGEPSIFQKKENGTQFFIGDKVIQTSNNYDLMVMNGDIGKIISKSGKDLIVEFDDREVYFTGLDPFDLDLAYAISIHKSQGSEYSSIIIPINSEHMHMLSRNLLYTGITRGKKQVVIIGEENTFRSAINAFWKDSRYTNLVSILKDEERLRTESNK